MEILDKMREQIDMKSLATKQLLRCSARDSYGFSYNFRKLLHRFGNLRVTYVEHNREIAQFINDHSNQVLALISNDTDFLAYAGNCELWLTNDIEVHPMTCRKVDKEKLYARFGFAHGAHQMRLLGALCGTDFLPMDMVIDFIKRLEDTRQDLLKNGKIWSVSEYVRRQSIEIVDNQPQFDLDKISADVFGADYTPLQRDAIAKSLAVYNVAFDEVELNFQDKYIGNELLTFCKEHSPFLFKLATDDVYVVKDYSFIDYRNYRSKTYSELIIPILMKICGILWKNDPERRDVREIFMKHAQDEPFKLTQEFVLYPSSKSYYFVMSLMREK